MSEAKNNKSEQKRELHVKESISTKDEYNMNELSKKYNHDIRNMLSLNNEMIDTIRDMSNENKMNIIISFNTVLKAMKSMLNI